MKRIFIITAACVAFSLTACQPERYPATLTVADSLIMVNPDSAQKVLLSVNTGTAEMTTRQRMYYDLLRLSADAMRGVKPSSDTLALAILEYYETGGDQRLLPRAYCCVAGTYRDLNDAPQALDFYQKTLNAMPNDGDLRLRSYVNSEMGDLFLRQRIYGKAFEYYRRSFQIASIRNDTSCMTKTLTSMAKTFENANADKCLECLKRAKQLNGNADTDISNMIDARLSVSFLNKKEYDSAWAHIQKPLKSMSVDDSCAILCIASDIYIRKGLVDSAKQFCHELMRMENVNGRMQASKALARIYLGENNLVLGHKYMECYMACVDSMDKMDATMALVNANSLYNYQVREKEIARMRMDRKTIIVALLCVFAIGGFVTSLLLFYNLKNKKREQVLKLRIGLLDKLEKDHRERSESEMNAKEQVIESLTKELNSIKSSHSDLERVLREQKQRFASSIENGKSTPLVHDEQRLTLLKSKAYATARAKLAVSKPISPSEWTTIMEELDWMLGDFKLLLYQACDLSEHEYKISLLVKMGFKNVDIGILVSRGENSISQTRKRLYTKITGREGSASDFDKLIKSL